MKLIKIAILFFSLMFGASCTLDIQQDPNSVDPNSAVPDLVLNSMQRNLAGLFSGLSQTGMGLTRQMNRAGSTYTNTIGPNGFDGIWTTAYANILTDGNALIKQTDASGFARHAGIARIINAYTLLMLTDVFGDIPYSTALIGSEEFNPAVDPGANVYAAAIALLDRAELDLTTNATTGVPAGYLSPTATTPQDQYFGNNYLFWRKLANTLKLKAYLNTRDGAVTPVATTAANINGLITSPAGLLLGVGENFMFHFGISQSDPDARHPLFVNNYPAGGGNYMSNWIMFQMYHGYDATQQSGGPGDPRIRFYFYRQELVNNTDPNNMRCATALAPPDHYPRNVGGSLSLNGAAGHPAGITTDAGGLAWSTNSSGATANLPRSFCYPTTVGYWGRDHIDPQGIPPDAFLRSAWGTYPAGGRFDNNTGADVAGNQGMQGAGIWPMMMRSFTNFMLAEAALMVPGFVGAAPVTYFTNGMQASFDDVRTFATTGTLLGAAQPAGPNEGTLINTFYPASGVGAGFYTNDVGAYMNHLVGANGPADLGGAVTQFNTPPGTLPAGVTSATEFRLNLIAREYWVAAYGNGVEAYNTFRRTGFPTGLQPTIQQTSPSDPFPRSYYYPQTFATLNSSGTQKTLDQRVFWDKNTSNINF